MAITTDQLTAMEAAYYSGLRSVTFGGRTVTYQDMDAMWRAILLARQEMQIATGQGGGTGGLRPQRFTTLRGF